MSDTKPTQAATTKHDPKSAKNTPAPDFFRETVESVVIAFVLAFLFRTFVAEAFVIPTGSMAVTLMGRHRDVECGNCGYWYQVSASSEADESGSRRTNVGVIRTLCPNCGFPMDTGDEIEYPSYRGDRIIVTKFGLKGPQRWDVIVFRYPQQAATNYIKRLVGLPNEVIRIENGDLFAHPLDADENAFRILRKPPPVVLAMLREVYDNEYVVGWMTTKGWPPRWQPCPMDVRSLVKAGWAPGDRGHNASVWTWSAQQEYTGAMGGWVPKDGYRTFTTDGTAQGEVWLRYQHFMPRVNPRDNGDWREIVRAAPREVKQHYLPGPGPGGSLYDSRKKQRDAMVNTPSAETISVSPQPQQIYDLIAYNHGEVENGGIDPGRPSPVWAGDLALECLVTPQEAGGEAVLELIEAGHRFHCVLNFKDGSINLSIDDGQLPFEDAEGKPGAKLATAEDALPTGEKVRVRFANVDSQLLVWINGRLATFDGFAAPPAYTLPAHESYAPTPADMTPAGIASRGAKLTVEGMRLFRDVYYLSTQGVADDYRLENDQFFVLGDNSPKSSDARMWDGGKYVDRKLLIGKALFIYWPHSWDTPLPFTPNFERMKFIR